MALDTNPNKSHIVTVGADNLGHIWRLNESGKVSFILKLLSWKGLKLSVPSQNIVEWYKMR